MNRKGCIKQVKLTDFGLSRKMTKDKLTTRVGTAHGTPLYMASEMLMSNE